MRFTPLIIFSLPLLGFGQDWREIEYPLPELNDGACASAITTPEGFLWFGLHDAIALFDRSTYRYFQYDPNDTTSITYGAFSQLAYDPRGYIWAGSNIGGLSRLNLKTGKSTTYFFDPDNENTLSGDRVEGICIDKTGNVWVTTDNLSLTRIGSDGSITRYPLPESERAKFEVKTAPLWEIIEDRLSPGTFWVGSNIGVYKFDSNDASFELFEAVDNGEELKESLTAVAQDEGGKLWFCTELTGRGIWSFDPTTNHWNQFKVTQGDADHRIANVNRDIICTGDNLIVATSLIEGIWIIDPTTDLLSLHGADPEYASTLWSNSIVVEDIQGDIWTGRFNLLRLTKKQPPFRFFPFYPQLNTWPKGNWQREFLDDPYSDNFFIGTSTGDGLLEVNIHTGKVIPHRFKAKEGDVFYDRLFESIAIAADTGVWIGSTDGLLFWDRATRRIRKVNVDDDQLMADLDDLIRSVTVEEDGKLLLSAESEGLVRWDPRTSAWTQLLNPIPKNSGRLKETKRAPDGRLWLTFDDDVVLLNEETGNYVFLPHRSGSAHGLSNSTIRDVQIGPNGDAWISTLGGGINRVTPNDDGTFHFRYYAEAEGLPTPVVYDLHVAPDDRIWAGTREGLSVIDPNTHLIINYRAADGLDFSAKSGALFQLESRHLLTGARGGFHYTHLDSLRLASQAPRPYLYNAETTDTTLLLAFADQARLRIGPSNNFFSVSWGAVAFEPDPVARYSYMLEGVDDDWIFAGERTFARYSRLPAGSYTFKLKAVNDRGVWSDELMMLQVKIVPPFTKTVWFYLLVGAVVLALIYVFYRLRVRRIKREADLKTEFEKELAQVEMNALRAQMNPHFLFNSLNSINRFIVKNEPKAASKYLTRFSRLMRLILDNSKTEKVTLTNELEAIKLYVELESLRFDNKFSFDLHVNDSVEADNIEIDSMILQPYIENAIWHGLMHKDERGNLKLSISQHNSTLRCIVEDDGVGRKKAAELKSKSAVINKSFGMKITSDRLHMLNKEKQVGASVEVIDLVDDEGNALGTRVEIELPC